MAPTPTDLDLFCSNRPALQDYPPLLRIYQLLYYNRAVVPCFYSVPFRLLRQVIAGQVRKWCFPRVADEIHEMR